MRHTCCSSCRAAAAGSLTRAVPSREVYRCAASACSCTAAAPLSPAAGPNQPLASAVSCDTACGGGAAGSARTSARHIDTCCSRAGAGLHVVCDGGEGGEWWWEAGGRASGGGSGGGVQTCTLRLVLQRTWCPAAPALMLGHRRSQGEPPSAGQPIGFAVRPLRLAATSCDRRTLATRERLAKLMGLPLPSRRSSDWVRSFGLSLAPLLLPTHWQKGAGR